MAYDFEFTPNLVLPISTPGVYDDDLVEFIRKDATLLDQGVPAAGAAHRERRRSYIGDRLDEADAHWAKAAAEQWSKLHSGELAKLRKEAAEIRGHHENLRNVVFSNPDDRIEPTALAMRMHEIRDDLRRLREGAVKIDGMVDPLTDPIRAAASEDPSGLVLLAIHEHDRSVPKAMRLMSNGDLEHAVEEFAYRKNPEAIGRLREIRRALQVVETNRARAAAELEKVTGGLVARGPDGTLRAAEPAKAPDLSPEAIVAAHNKPPPEAA
jgi:hypothetical protein